MGGQLAIYAVIVVYSGLALCGLIGNLWVMWTVLSQLIGCSLPSSNSRPTKSSLQSSAFIYLLLLSVVDLISFIPVPMLVADILQNQWPFGISLCKLSFICEGINKTLSPMVLTALSVDRYIAVCHPTLVWMRQTRFSLFTVFICIMASQTFIVPIAMTAKIAPMIDKNGKEIEKCVLLPHRSFDVSQAIACYLVPLVFICSVYAAILLKLYRHTRISSVGRKTSISLSRVVKCSVMVVAFYFICWTPYFSMQLIPLLFPKDNIDDHDDFNISATAINATVFVADHVNLTEEVTQQIIHTGPSFDGLDIFLMYMMHALPYAQSAFNWLFYAFLNRNLRNSGQRCNNNIRNTAVTTTLFADGNSNASHSQTIWKNIQQMGNQLKTASVDTGHMLLKKSPFMLKSRIQSRSSTFLDNTMATDYLMITNGLPNRASMLDVRASSLGSQTRSNSLAASPRNDPSESSSFEWL